MLVLDYLEGLLEGQARPVIGDNAADMAIVFKSVLDRTEASTTQSSPSASRSSRCASTRRCAVETAIPKLARILRDKPFGAALLTTLLRESLHWLDPERIEMAVHAILQWIRVFTDDPDGCIEPPESLLRALGRALAFPETRSGLAAISGVQDFIKFRSRRGTSEETAIDLLGQRPPGRTDDRGVAGQRHLRSL